MGSQFKSTGIEINGGGSFGGRGHELVAGEPHLGGPDVGEPGGPAGAAACVVALQEIGDHLGKQVSLGAFSFGVHGAGPVVVGQDRPEVVCG